VPLITDKKTRCIFGGMQRAMAFQTYFRSI